MDATVFDRAAAALPTDVFATPPDVGIILGSGWGDALRADRDLVRVPYAAIPGLGAATVAGHAGELRLYERAGRRVAAFCGRRHWYEGVGWEAVVLPVELLRRAGCRTLLLTNASGGIDPALRPGDFVIVRDHINTVGLNPLAGPHNPAWGPRFPDLSAVYPAALRGLLRAAAEACGVTVREGVYAFTAGPVFETPAEIRAYARWGADVVGMSTAPEATFACACGLGVAALALVSNPAAGVSADPLRHDDVLRASAASGPAMAGIIDGFITRLPPRSAT